MTSTTKRPCMPLVTIYVPCRNYGRFLDQCLQSVMSQLYLEWELIVIDEGSDDQTSAIAEKYRQERADRVRFIRNNDPIGVQRIANLVLGLANGKYLMRLDADDWLDEGALLLMVAKLESSDGAGLVYGNYYYTDEVGKVLGIERRHRLGTEDIVGQLPPHGACTMFQTRALKAVGGYSEDVNAQDGWELWYKLLKRVGAVNVDAPIFYYRQHGNSLSRDSERLLAARAKIFERISSSLNGSYEPTCLAVVPAKESYPGFDDVPFHEIEGRSLLEIAIASATKSKKVTQVTVSSQSKRVLAYSERLEAAERVPKHARIVRQERDDRSGVVPIREILLHAGRNYCDEHGAPPDIVVFLSLHAISRRSDHIDKALNVLRITECDSVVSVQEEREPVFSHGNAGLKLLNPGRFHDLSYDRERMYRFNGALICAWWDVLSRSELLGEKIGYIEMSAKESLQVTNARGK